MATFPRTFAVLLTCTLPGTTLAGSGGGFMQGRNKHKKVVSIEPSSLAVDARIESSFIATTAKVATVGAGDMSEQSTTQQILNIQTDRPAPEPRAMNQEGGTGEDQGEEVSAPSSAVEYKNNKGSTAHPGGNRWIPT